MRWLLAWPFLTPKAVCGTRCGNRREGEPDLWCGDCVPVLSRLAHTDVCVCVHVHAWDFWPKSGCCAHVSAGAGTLPW